MLAGFVRLVEPVVETPAGAPRGPQRARAHDDHRSCAARSSRAASSAAGHEIAMMCPEAQIDACLAATAVPEEKVDDRTNE